MFIELVNSLRPSYAYICDGKLAIVGSDDGLSPGQCQAIIWTNAGIMLIGPLETNCSKILIKIHIFTFKKLHLKVSSGKWRPFCLSLNVLTISFLDWMATQTGPINLTAILNGHPISQCISRVDTYFIIKELLLLFCASWNETHVRAQYMKWEVKIQT